MLMQDALTDAMRRAYDEASGRLLAQRDGPGGAWQGRLSCSALATSVAVFSLATIDVEAHRELIRRGLGWLEGNANRDGGWGDSPGSPSNLPATVLAWAALSIDAGVDCAAVEQRAAAWLRGRIGSLEPAALGPMKARLQKLGTLRTRSP